MSQAEFQSGIERAELARRQHLGRLRELNRRQDACAEAGGTSDALDAIQKLIDAENNRWSACGGDTI
ncbi:MAG TPA: hypothetical protein VK742_20260 [Candidatus Sulfotelmatobacter sp.]|jgi:hypothetical protein|nr:hypothetical protein [Candidatus Sulfotelmatobacter sp.]